MQPISPLPVVPQSEPLAWMTDDGRVVNAQTKLSGMPTAARDAYHIPQYAAQINDAAARDALRLRFVMECGAIEGFFGVDMDRYEYACEVAQEHGRDEPNEDDELEGFRRLIDTAIAKDC